MEDDRLYIRQITLLSKAAVTVISKCLLHSLFTEQFLHHHSKLSAIKRWSVSKNYSAAPYPPASASRGSAWTSDRSRLPSALWSSCQLARPCWHPRGQTIFFWKSRVVTSQLPAESSPAGSSQIPTGDDACGDSANVTRLGLEPGCGPVSTLGWVAGRVSMHSRVDWFPDFWAAPWKVSKESDPSALWEGNGELMSSGEALGVASDNKFSSCLGGENWKANMSLKTSWPWACFGRDELFFTTFAAFRHSCWFPLQAQIFKAFLTLKIHLSCQLNPKFPLVIA